MELIIAKHGGFCFGVKRAVETALFVTDKKDALLPIYTYGPLIHNEDVVHMLSSRGAKVIDSIENLNDCTVIVRSHGVGEEFYLKAKNKGINVIDTTCVFVAKVHRIVKENSQAGHRIIICGDPSHPEIIGICGWASEKHHVVKSVDEVLQLEAFLKKSGDTLCIVSQTTLNMKLWDEMIFTLKSFNIPLEIFNTICSATRLRQEEVTDISQNVDLVLVVGGKNSSNTQKLYEIAKKYAKNAQHIENVEEISVNLSEKYDKIGIVAGASTPDWVILEVIQKLKSEGEVVVNGRQ